MNLSKRNHYLPKFYLHQFTQNNDNSIFWVHYKGEKKPRTQTPVNTGIEKHLYNVKKGDGSFDDSVEKYLLSPMEGKVGPIIKRLIASESRLENKDIPDLALFLSFMATRIPRSIQAAREVGETIIVYMMKDLLNKPDEIQKLIDEAKQEGITGNDISAEVFKNHLNDFENRYKISFDKKYATGLSLFSSIAVLKELINMNWCLCRAPSNTYFITSDCPLVCFVLNDDGSAMFGGGFGLLDAEVTFPLSPTRCLYLDRKHTHRYRAISKKVLQEINKRTAWVAKRFIISHIKSKYAQDLSDWASESLNYPKMDREKLFKRFHERGLFKNKAT